MKNFTKIIILILAISLISLLFLPIQPKKNNVSMGIQVGKSLNSFFLMYVAEKKGFFNNEGLNVTVIPAGPNVLVNSLIANQIDFIYPLPSAINAKLSGADIKLVMPFSKDDLFLVSNASSIRELKDKKIAISAIGGLSYAKLFYLLKNNNMTFSDVQLIVIPDINQRIQSLKSHSTDAAIVPNTVFRPQEFKMVLYLSKNSSTAILGAVITTDKFLNENPKTTMKFITAIAKAVKYVYDDKEGTIQLLQDGMGLDKVRAEEFYNFIIDNHYYTTKLDLNNLNTEIKEIAEASGKEPIPISLFVNTSFVDSLPKELQI